MDDCVIIKDSRAPVLAGGLSRVVPLPETIAAFIVEDIVDEGDD